MTAPAQGTTGHGTNSSALGEGQEEEMYDALCGICFTEVHPRLNPRGKINSCEHLFCSNCIKLWAKNTNVCPTCKARFTRIYTLDSTTGKEEETKVRRRNYIAWEESYYEEEEEEEADDGALPAGLHDDDDDDDILGLTTSSRQRGRGSSSASAEAVQCEVCHESRNAARIIFCDRRECTYAAHLDCLSMAERPLTFLCPRCTALRDGVDAGSVSTARTVGPSTVAAPPPGPPSSQAAAPTSPPPPPARTRHTATAQTTATAAPLEARPRRRPRAAEPSLPEPPGPLQPPARGRTRRPTPAMDMGPIASASSATPARAPPPSWEGHTASPVDLSKPTLDFRSHPAFADVEREGEQEEDPLSRDTDLYFLAPTKHSREAAKELKKLNESRTSEANLRRAREESRRRRLEDAAQHQQHTMYGIPNMGYHAATRHNPSSPSARRPAEAEDRSANRHREMLDVAEADLLNPQLRATLEERMAREWATDLVHVLRRNQVIEESRLRLDSNGDPIRAAPPTQVEVAAKEDGLWQRAMAQARTMVQARLHGKLCEIRERRERLVKAEAQREAAALSKLARIIAARRSAVG